MKVSVLLVTYNHEAYIEKAVESILIQRDCPDFEVVIADDCSKDNTVKLAIEMFARFENVRVLSNEGNLGITKNYQRGFSLCKGEYIFVLEGDDYWIDPLKIKRQVEFLEQNPFCVMCFHPFLTQQNDLGLFSRPSGTFSPNTNLFDVRDIILNEGLIANFSVCCYRSAVLSKLPRELYEIVSYDWMINISVAQYGFLGRIDKTMSVYRLSETGTWSNISLKRKHEEVLKLIPQYDKVLEYKYTDIFNQKAELIKEEIRDKQDVNTYTVRSFIPPVLVFMLKWILPPICIKLLKRR